jgi:hypothetical protein
MQAGDYQGACAKLEESYRLDPATGALYALALCHERLGKLATAWVEFMDAAARAKAERYKEREESARQHAEALAPRLSTLMLNVVPQTAELPGLMIFRNGVALGRAAWGTAIPVDPGRHVLRAEAPGRTAWKAEVVIEGDARRQIVHVPELALAPKPARVEPLRAKTPRLAPRGASLMPLQIAAVGVAGAGLSSLVFAGVAAIRALDLNASSDENCQDNRCNSAGLNDRSAAREAANFATAGAIVGGALVGIGTAVFVLGRPSQSSTPESSFSVSVSPLGVSASRSF